MTKCLEHSHSESITVTQPAFGSWVYKTQNNCCSLCLSFPERNMNALVLRVPGLLSREQKEPSFMCELCGRKCHTWIFLGMAENVERISQHQCQTHIWKGAVACILLKGKKSCVVNNLVKIYSNMTLIFNTRNGIGVQDILLNSRLLCISPKNNFIGFELWLSRINNLPNGKNNLDNEKFNLD
jgi:hypothetical protein